MNYSPRSITQEALHSLCRYNNMAVLRSDRCGCFSCCETFPAERATELINNGKTVLCPLCRIDAVLPDSWIELSGELLVEMNVFWMGASDVPF